MKIDSHQHFWTYSKEDYGWINDDMSVIKQDFYPADLAPLLKSIDFDGCIAVQARQSLEETDFLLKLSDEHNFIKAVVGWVDLKAEDCDTVLERYTQHPKFKGVRHIIHDEPDIDFMLDSKFYRGVGLLAKHQLSYDLLLYPQHLPNAIKFVSDFPEQMFILDHISKPFIAKGELSPWRDDIQRLAGFPNIYCKLSGMVTEANWQSWKAADFEPYLDTVLEAFGTRRLMLGSDWPVCKLAGEYQEVMQLTIDYIGKLSEAEQAAIFSENACKAYRI